jgi:periplasmic divalent cation tolerance protein
VPKFCLVLTTLPDADIAAKLARNLVEARLAACVNILPSCQSIYRWQGKVHEEGEIPLVIKTTVALYPAVETYLRQNHPYDLPEIIVLDIAQGLPEYLRWIAESTDTTQF